MLRHQFLLKPLVDGLHAGQRHRAQPEPEHPRPAAGQPRRRGAAGPVQLRRRRQHHRASPTSRKASPAHQPQHGLRRAGPADRRQRPGVWGAASYSYDGLDNLRTSVVGGRTSVHNYDANNRLASINTNGVYTGYAYDAQGNVTGRGTKGFYFDQANRLWLANGVASYAYDGLGRRTMNWANDGTTHWYMYDQAGQLLYTQWAQGAVANSIKYIYIGGKAIAEVNGTTGVTYLHTDALGSPVARTNAAGAVVTRTRYEPYGNTAAGTIPNGIGFTGHVNDPDTGLVYMQQRYYDPIAGRFLSTDPVTTDADTGYAFNRYEYVSSNPYRYTDPDGRDRWGDDAWTKPVAQLQNVTVTAPRITASSATAAPTLPVPQLNRVTITAPRIAPIVRPAIWMLLFTPTTLGDATCDAPSNPCGGLIFNRPKNPPDVAPPGS